MKQAYLHKHPFYKLLIIFCIFIAFFIQPIGIGIFLIVLLFKKIIGLQKIIIEEEGFIIKTNLLTQFFQFKDINRVFPYYIFNTPTHLIIEYSNQKQKIISLLNYKETSHHIMHEIITNFDQFKR